MVAAATLELSDEDVTLIEAVGASHSLCLLH
jgi:hypothetical protein